MIRQSVSAERWRALEEQERKRAQEHAAIRSVPSIPRRSARTKLLELTHDAGYTSDAPDESTPTHLFEAFLRFIDIPITGVEAEHDDVLFECHSPGRDGGTEVRFLRQLSRHDRDENYLGMQTISIELLFPADESEPTPNQTIWADHDRPGTWADEVRASNGFRTLLDGKHAPEAVHISQDDV